MKSRVRNRASSDGSRDLLQLLSAAGRPRRVAAWLVVWACVVTSTVARGQSAALPSTLTGGTTTLLATSGTGTVTGNSTLSGTTTINLNYEVEYLIVGGGAGAGSQGAGGGGAGGVRTGTSTLGVGSYGVMVGARGNGSPSTMITPVVGAGGNPGSASSFNGLVAGGGGIGGDQDRLSQLFGGSGGGGGGGTNGPAQQVAGAAGGSGSSNGGGAGGQRQGGGGGGGALTSGSARLQMSSGTSGQGGQGIASSFSGASVTYASGGGGGGVYPYAGQPSRGGYGGPGGTGAGDGGSMSSSGTTSGGNATTYGSGGGGGATMGDNNISVGGTNTNFWGSGGGNGMQGVVMLRYTGAAAIADGGQVTTGTGAAAGYMLQTFTIDSTPTSSGTFSFLASQSALGNGLGTTITSNLDGTGGLAFAGPGRLTLSGSNSYSGGSQVSGSGSVLTFANTSARPASGQVSVAAGSGIGLRVGGAGGFTQADVAALFSGAFGNVTNDANSFVGIDTTAGDVSYTTPIAGTRGLAKLGTGGLTLAAGYTSSGGMRVLSGTLNLDNRSVAANVLVASGVLASGTVAGNVTLNAGASLSGVTVASGGGLALGNGYSTTQVANLVNTGTFAGATLSAGALAGIDNAADKTITDTLNGSRGFVKLGEGNLVMSGSNSYSGGTVIAAGKVVAGANAGLGTGAVQLAGGSLGIRPGVTMSAAIQLNAASSAIGAEALDVEYLVVGGGGGGGGAENSNGGDGGGGGGAGGLLQGSLSLATGSSYTVVVGAGGSGGAASTNGSNGGNSQLASVTASGGGGGGREGNNGLAGGSGGGGGANYAVSPTTYFGGQGTSGQGFAGGDASTQGNPSANRGSAGGGGAGASGGNPITVSGLAGQGGGLGGYGVTSSISGSSTVYAGGGGGGGPSSSGTGGLGGGGNSAFGSGTAVAGASNLGGGGGGGAGSTNAAVNRGAGGGSGIVIARYLTISGTQGSGGTVTTGSNAAAGYTVHTFTSTGTTSLTLPSVVSTITGQVSGTGSFEKVGAGTLVLSNSNSFSGSTKVSVGTLRLGSALALQNSPLDTSGDGVVDVTGQTSPTLGGLTGSKNLSSVITTGFGSMTSLTLNPQSGVTNTYSGVIANGSSSGMSVTKSGQGTQVLTGSNSYTGGSTISAGVLQVGNGGTTGSISGDIVNNASLVFNRSDRTTFSGTISGAGSQTVIRSGTLALGANGSIANSGTVVVGDAGSNGVVLDLTALSSYTFGSGQTLGGKGTLLGNPNDGTTVTITGVLSPGNSPGILTFNDVNLELSASNTLMEVFGPTVGVDYDQIKLTGGGALTYGGTMTIDFGSFSTQSGTFNLFSYQSTSSGGFDTIIATGSFYSGTFQLTSPGVYTLSGSQQLTFTQNVAGEGGVSYGQLVVVPEPLTLGLLGICSGVAVITFRRLRRRAAKA